MTQENTFSIQFPVQIQEWMRSRWSVLIGLCALQFACYTYFLTVPLLSNHTFPNVWLYNYPSWKTASEGRWFADMIILFQGSSGVQSFQFVCAVILQAVNGLLLADLLKTKKQTNRFLLAGVLCLFPLFPDYYSFACDHITFVLGDTLCLVAALFWISYPQGLIRIMVPASLYLLSIAAYGPKVSLVVFLASVSILLRIQWCDQFHRSQNLQRINIEIFSAASVVLLALLGYWITFKLTFIESYDGGKHTHLSTLPEILEGTRAAYSEVIIYYAEGMGGFPEKLSWLPLGIMLAGVFYMILTMRSYGIIVLALTVLILALIPVMLSAPWIINAQSFKNCARIGAAYGYAFVFFLGVFMSRVRPLLIGKATAATTLYFLLILATQQNNAACFKSIYETNIINRILERCNAVMQTGESVETPLVVIGEYPRFDAQRFVKYPPTYAIQQSTPAFAPYRQVEILNFLDGRNSFRRPTTEEVREALMSSSGRKPWPDPQSIYISGKTLVVLLQKYSPGIKTTWDQPK